ncbi:uncharacterized protein FPRO_13319 [Fusarium proliferatum ET1]|uniref:Uncharacterized protein n=1 Tax=Fusarium proliferatum (strain ET1) TaxID=1227346 RepID=A0A1L7W556_FUSPR|nr:uncharacterized protein FPRO_13319 [Fusarium proliferatum ET1]CZR47652.1 uncharacterized protein FPRO_13319 [Fusarium proliferatum ET1]
MCTDGRNTATTDISSGHRCTRLVHAGNPGINIITPTVCPARRSKPGRGPSRRITHRREGFKFSFTLIVHPGAPLPAAKHSSRQHSKSRNSASYHHTEFTPRLSPSRAVAERHRHINANA